MCKELIKVIDNGNLTIDSREVANLIEKDHSKLLRDIRTYIKYLNEAKIGLVDYFIESTYKDSKGEKRRCYNLTEMGCQMVANKLTGKKGTVFTAKYVKAFNSMKDYIEKEKVPSTIEDMMIKQLEEHKKMKEQQRLFANKLDVVEDKLDNQMTIDHGQQRLVQRAVGVRVYDRLQCTREWIGINKSNYTIQFSSDNVEIDEAKEHVKYLRPIFDKKKRKYFQSIYKEIKNRFGVPSYRDVKIKDFDSCINYIKSWIECQELREMD